MLPYFVDMLGYAEISFIATGQNAMGACVVSQSLLDDLPGIVVGAIIRNDNFKGLISLAECPLNRLFNHGVMIVGKKIEADPQRGVGGRIHRRNFHILVAIFQVAGV